MSDDFANNAETGGSSCKFTSHSRADGGMAAPSLRILCLHDGHSNAGELSDQLEFLGERLYEKHMIDLVYVNAPLLVPGSKDEFNPLDPNPKRLWWEERKTQSQENEDPQHKQFLGLDASLLLLRQIWDSMPFWGVLAVGKGAATAALFALLPLNVPPQFLIFVHGETLLDETELLVDNTLSRSCLHILSSCPSESSEKLVQQFGGNVVTASSEEFTNKAMNVIGKFLIQQKKSLRASNSEAGNILVLQNHLFIAEQEAANMVAQRIAMDPPKALMAVVSPQNVGGWSGGRRRAPNEEGGGAPCPSEFLLRREKRSTDPEGSSREHPNETKTSTAKNENTMSRHESEDGE